MSFTRKLTSAAIVTSLIIGSFGASITAAQADGWRDRSEYGHRDANSSNWNNGNRWLRYHHNNYGNYYRHRHHHHHDGRAVALGITALVIGAMIASAARDHEYRDYRD